MSLIKEFEAHFSEAEHAEFFNSPLMKVMRLHV